MPNFECGGDLDAVLGGSFVQDNANVCAVVNVNTFAKKDAHSQYKCMFIMYIYFLFYSDYQLDTSVYVYGNN